MFIWLHAHNVVENFTVISHLGKKMHLGTCYKCENDRDSISLWIKTFFTVLASNSKRGRSYYHSAPTIAVKGPGRCGLRLVTYCLPAAHVQDRVPFETSCPQISRMEEGTLSLGYKNPRALTLKLKMAVFCPMGLKPENLIPVLVPRLLCFDFWQQAT